jgi:hypothetical protein
MSAAAALSLAESAGVSVCLDGDMLRLVASVEPPADVLAALKAAKPEIVALLRREESGGQDGRDSEDDVAARILIGLNAMGFGAMLWEDGALMLRDLRGQSNRPRSPPQALAHEFWAHADAIGRWLEEGGTI